LSKHCNFEAFKNIIILKFMSKTVCVFCASSRKADDSYVVAATTLAKLLVERGYTIKYGGGEVGLMGVLADTAIEHQGHVIGIIPKFMVEVEWQHKGVEQMVLVDTMAERKKLLVEDTDAVIALPGSTGTLEELVEVMSMKKLGGYTKPIIIVNTNGFYNHLIALLERMASEQFMRHEHLSIYTVVDTPEQAIDAIEEIPHWTADAISFAAV
jgi:hypothetical protein